VTPGISILCPCIFFPRPTLKERNGPPYRLSVLVRTFPSLRVGPLRIPFLATGNVTPVPDSSRSPFSPLTSGRLIKPYLFFLPFQPQPQTGPAPPSPPLPLRIYPSFFSSEPLPSVRADTTPGFSFTPAIRYPLNAIFSLCLLPRARASDDAWHFFLAVPPPTGPPCPSVFRSPCLSGARKVLFHLEHFSIA